MNVWKVLAIVLLILLVIENLFIYLGIKEVEEEEEKEKQCLYDICSSFYDAEYLENVCYCYELDFFGNYMVNKTEYMG